MPTHHSGPDALPIYDLASSTEHEVKCINQLVSFGPCGPRALAMGDVGIVVKISKTHCKRGDTWLYRFDDSSFGNVSKKYGGVWHTEMSGSRVVWTEAMAKHTQIVLYDAKTNIQRVLSAGDGDQFRARIEGDRIVWVDHRNAPGNILDQGNSDIYAKSTKTGRTLRITSQRSFELHPQVDRGRVFFTMLDARKIGSVFMVELPSR